MSGHIRYQTLADCPEHIPYLANLYYQALGKIWSNDTSMDMARSWLETHLNRNSLPLTLVALEGDNPVGMVSLLEDDGLGATLTPWLGSLVVHPDYRHRKIGETLIQKLIEKAKSLEFKSLYLFAYELEITRWYENLGWQHLGKDIYKEHPVYVMEYPMENESYVAQTA